MTIDPTLAAYDDHLPDPTADTDLPREREAFCALLPPGGRVLDLGCGSAWAARRLRADGFRAVGLDRSVGRIGRASASLSSEGAPVPLILGDMRALPIASDSLDGVWACASLLHLPKAELPGILAAIHGLLRPGGALFVSLKEGDGEAWQTRGAARRFFAYYHADELDARLAEAGFCRGAAWRTVALASDPAHAWLGWLGVAEMLA